MENEPTLIEKYIQSGQARLVYRHLQQLGPGSRVLSEASECAGAQDRFWEMRELIYRRQDELRGADSFASVQPLVADLGLDEAQFQSCMDSGEYGKQVDDDNAASQREGITSRPVTVIAGRRIIGGQSLGVYESAIEAAGR